jgi:hypothetical protein
MKNKTPRKDKYLRTEGGYCIGCKKFTPYKNPYYGIRAEVCGDCAKELRDKMKKLKGFYVTSDNQYIEVKK